MKKNLLLILVFVSLFITACSMGSNNTKANDSIQKSSTNIDKLVGAGYKDVEKSFDTPYSSVYYIDADKFKNKDLNTLTLDDMRDSIAIVSSYEVDKNKDSYLHVYYENGKAKQAENGKYSLSKSDKFNSNVVSSQADYKVEFFKNKGMICEKDFTIENAKKDFIGKTIKDFNKSYSVNCANFIAHTINNDEKLYFYPLVPHEVHPNKEHSHPHYASNNIPKDSIVNPANNNISSVNQADNKNLGEYAKSAIAVYTKNNKIEKIEIVNNDFIKGILGRVLAK